MKPITKNEKEVDRLAKTLPALTGKQLKWISRNAVPATAYRFKDKQAWCSNCGHVFDDSHKQGRCPHCGAKFTEHKQSPRKQVERNKWYTTILTTCEGWQVSRHFMVEHYAYKDGHQDQSIREAVQIWTNERGEQVINARSVCMSCLYYDVWNFNSELSIKRRPAQWSFGWQRYDIFSPANMVCRVLPILKRNGFTGEALSLISPDDLFPMLLKDNFAETLIKTRQYGLLGLLSTSRGIDKAVAMICVRHNYIVKADDAKMWRDYIEMCEELGKDVHNPQVCCPADLKAAHDDAVARIERRREQERRREEAERKRRDKEAAKAYPERMGKFFGLLITDGGISIRVLQSIDEFKAEGKAMHHCVYANSYYAKADSLILTARDAEGKRLETIEIDLKTFKIIQSRGVCNQDSPRHKDIVKLMKGHMNEVRRLAKPKRAKKAEHAEVRAAA